LQQRKTTFRSGDRVVYYPGIGASKEIDKVEKRLDYSGKELSADLEEVSADWELRKK